MLTRASAHAYQLLIAGAPVDQRHLPGASQRSFDLVLRQDRDDPAGP